MKYLGWGVTFVRPSQRPCSPHCFYTLLVRKTNQQQQKKKNQRLLITQVFVQYVSHSGSTLQNTCFHGLALPMAWMDLIQCISGNAFNSFFQRSVENEWAHILAWELEDLRVLKDDGVKVTLCVPVYAHYAYTPCISVPGSLSLRSWWELLTTVAWGPGVCSPLMCVLCWSFTKSAWRCLLLPPSSSVWKLRLHLLILQGYSFFQSAPQSDGCTSKSTPRPDPIAQPSTRKNET